MAQTKGARTMAHCISLPNDASQRRHRSA